MKNKNENKELKISAENHESNISKSYSEIKRKISPNVICKFLSKEFDIFYCSVKSKSIEDKCISFQLFRQKCHYLILNMYLRENLNKKDYFIQNSLFDYIDCSISMLFFRNQFDHSCVNCDFFHMSSKGVL